MYWGQAEKALENTARKYLHTLYFTWKWCTYQINDKCWISVKHKITHYSVTLSFAHVDKVNIGGCEVKKIPDNPNPQPPLNLYTGVLLTEVFITFDLDITYQWKYKRQWVIEKSAYC